MVVESGMLEVLFISRTGDSYEELLEDEAVCISDAAGTGASAFLAV